MSEHEGNIFGQGFGEDSGQSGEHIGGTDSDVGDGAISEDENGGDGIDVLPNYSSEIFLVVLVLPDTSSVRQPGGVEDANLGKGLHIRIALINASTYHHAVLARKVVKASRVGLTLVVGIPLLVRVVEKSEVVVINVIAKKHIGDVFHD